MPSLPSRLRATLLAVVLTLPLLIGAAPDMEDPAAQTAPPASPTAGGFLVYQLIDAPTCTTLGLNVSSNPYFVTDECGFAVFTMSGVPDGATVTGQVVGPYGATEDVPVTGPDDAGEWRARFTFTDASPVGELDLRILVDGVEAGRTRVFHNMLDAQISVPAELAPGEEVPVSGTIAQLDATGSDALPVERTEVPASFTLQVRGPDGTVQPGSVPVTAADDGSFTATLPAESTASLAPADGRLSLTAAVDAVDAVYEDWAAGRAGTAALTLGVDPSDLQFDASFVSSTGWVKPGESFPFRVTVTNATGAAVEDAVVTMAAPDAVTFTDAIDLAGGGGVDQKASTITWTLPTVAVGTPETPTTSTLVVEALADDLDADPEVVWKDLSITAELEAGGQSTSSQTHGPKVIPPTGGFDTARYGDKPFPIVPVDYRDRTHEDDHTGDKLARVINSEDVEGSTFNLYQEMSYGQLFPIGTVPSAGVATAGFEYEPGFDFTTPERAGTCRGTSAAELGDPAYGTPLYPQRVVDGWYQLPGDTEYYGGDFPAFTLGVGSTIDGACGPTGKSVYDAAVIADPEIDYDQFDSDKDGVVDFFMMVFVGLGGNGDSQINGTPPYDNIWPHSSSLELDFRDPETGLRGYVTDDQLTSRLGVPQCWVDDTYTQFDDCAAHGGTGDDDLPNHVRVGPYNVNPESAIDAASVISHEYGHHLGLPDFYSGGATGNPYYDSMNLMASDHSQHMTIFGKQDLGWVVPQVVQPGEEVTVEDWREIKTNTGEIHWQTPDGEPYVLSEAAGDQNVRNGQAYTVKLPQELIIDPDKVAEQASAPHVFWSGRGNDFGCSPTGGHNMDVLLPELADVPAGADVELSFRSNFDIEWDWDYGFVLTSTDGQTYESVASDAGFTTPSAYNPNNAGCLNELDNGITGTTTAYQQGEPFVTAARNPVAPDYSGDHPFLTDSYDISSLAGEVGARLRFSYFTDAAFDRPGWFVDDIVVTVDGEELVRIDGSDELEGRVFQGGCDPHQQVAAVCTAGWQVVDATAANPADHGYYLELRDRSEFDFDGKGQSDRGMADWEPGVFIEYTDESHGYGNNGVPPPPAQHYLDSVPEPGAGCDTTTCEDSAFRAVEGRNHFDDDSADGGWVDNHSDDGAEDGLWRFAYDCLSLDVTAMAGTDAAPTTNLVADAVIRAGEGCRTFAYTTGERTAADNAAPSARFSHRPVSPTVGQQVTFDGSGSTDDAQTAAQLAYAWDLDGDGQFDDGAEQVVTTAYDTAGEVEVALRVTDADGANDTTIRTVVVRPADAGPGDGSDDGDDGGSDGDTGSGDAVGRRYGDDRIETAAVLSRSTWQQADTAVLARADAFPDALAAATLAAEVDGPILLTASDGLDDRVRAELERLGVRDVYLVGGDQALSPEVEAQVEAAGMRPERVAGPDRYATAAAIAREVVALGGAVDGAIVALGDRADGRDAFPDALAASQVATRTRQPVLLVTPDVLPDATRDALASLVPDGADLTVAGGPQAVGTAVTEQLREMGHGIDRIAGEDRYQTASLLADAALRAGASGTAAWVVSGTAFPDALTAGPAAHAADAVLLLTDPGVLPAYTRGWLERHAGTVDAAIVVGGPDAIDPAVDGQVQDAIE